MFTNIRENKTSCFHIHWVFFYFNTEKVNMVKKLYFERWLTTYFKFHVANYNDCHELFVH